MMQDVHMKLNPVRIQQSSIHQKDGVGPTLFPILQFSFDPTVHILQYSETDSSLDETVDY